MAEMVTVRADDLRVVLDSISDNKSTGACNFAWEKECAERLRMALTRTDKTVHVHITQQPDDRFGAGLAAGYEEGRRHGRR